MIYIYVLLGIGVPALALIWWLLTSVARGARQRDERLLVAIDPIAERLLDKEPVTAEEVAALSRQPQYRPMLYAMLKHFERLDLFPAQDLSLVAQGEGALAYWMMHPNELQDAPSQIELVEKVERSLQGERCKLLVFRYRMPPGHWAEKDGWLIGLAGPFFSYDVPYNLAAGFSRYGDKYGAVEPTELVDWFVAVFASRYMQNESR